VVNQILLPFLLRERSTAASAGKWAYTYTGTVFTQNGPLPAASVGHFSQDLAGNLTGSQTRSVAGSSGVEDISGTVGVNKDCTGTATISVLLMDSYSVRRCWP